MTARIYMVLVVALGACGKPAPSPAADAAEPTTALSTTGEPADASTPVDEVAATEEVAEDPMAAALERVSKLEVAGMTKGRAVLQSDYVTIAFDSAQNDRGISASLELTVSACRDCPTPALKDRIDQKAALVTALGELHAKNPGLVFDIKELELMPQRVGIETYVRSFVADETTRASMHTLEVTFSDNGFMFRFFAYPRSGMGQTADELASAYTRDELEAGVKALFAATSTALWPPVK